ncbi:unnamed protein product [Sympodiomycopsis kandeliae]
MPPRRKASGSTSGSTSLQPQSQLQDSSSPSQLQPATSLPFAADDDDNRMSASMTKPNGTLDTNGHLAETPTEGDNNTPTIGETTTPGGHISATIQKQMDSAGIDQFELPRAVVTRVSKSELPDNVQIRKEAVLAISKSATIFISYLAAVSDELAKQNSRKTVSVSDVIEGLGLMEFPQEIRAEVKANLKAFRQLEADKKNKSKSSNATAEENKADEEQEDDDEEQEEQEEEEEEADATTTTTIAPPPAAGGNTTVDADAEEQEQDDEDEDTELRMVQEGIDDEDEEMADD